MYRAHPHRKALWIILAGWAGISGCTHNYYYTNPNCVSGETVTTQVGSVCDVPSGQVIAGSSTPSTVVAQPPARRVASSPPGSSRVVISQPGTSAQTGRAGNRLAGWRRPDPDSMAVTRVEGALDAGSVNR
ncbi:hypothetical protein TA3x_004389 [Tundrisphaera sp. TA3]|uniref:hypothetical protein n=1 Tax=Tundrisphaera sp. TA3 TaxID=3435775 RepID=UPI003EBB2ACB